MVAIADTKNPTNFLNNAFFERVQKASQGDQTLKINDFHIGLVSSAGEHYSSIIYQANVQYTSKFNKNATIALIVKIISSKVNKLTDDSSFDTELRMYMNTVPDMQRLFGLIGEDVQIAPALIYYTKDPVPILVLEDISQNGFVVQREPLDLANTKIVTSKIAQFHATSFYLNRDLESEGAVSLYKNGLFNMKQSDGLVFMKDNMRLFTEQLKKTSINETYIEKFEKLQENFLKRGENVYDSGKNSFNVLNHGDFHYKNMMIKKDNEEIKNIFFLDFQLSVWGTPAIDIFYLLYMIASTETRANHRAEIVTHYFTEFNATLNKLGFMGTVPSLNEFNIELLKNGFLEVVITVCFLPFLYADFDKLEDKAVFGNGTSDDIRTELFANEEYQKNVESLLPEFLYKGFLD